MLKAAKMKAVDVIEDADKRIENTSLIKHSSESMEESRLSRFSTSTMRATRS